MTLAPAETFDAIVYPTPRRGVNGDAGDNAGVGRTMARTERFELPTPKFVAWCSIQLSYERNRYMLPNKHPSVKPPSRIQGDDSTPSPRSGVGGERGIRTLATS